MRYLFAITAGLWLASLALAGDQAPTLPVDYPRAVPAACAPGADPLAGSAVGGADTGSRFWGLAEFLYWHANGSNTPPLITTGVLGAPGTAVVAGGRELNKDFFPGLRFGAGFWLDECQNWGIEGSYFFLFDDSDSTRVSS